LQWERRQSASLPRCTVWSPDHANAPCGLSHRAQSQSCSESASRSTVSRRTEALCGELHSGYSRRDCSPASVRRIEALVHVCSLDSRGRTIPNRSDAGGGHCLSSHITHRQLLGGGIVEGMILSVLGPLSRAEPQLKRAADSWPAAVIGDTRARLAIEGSWGEARLAWQRRARGRPTAANCTPSAGAISGAYGAPPSTVRSWDKTSNLASGPSQSSGGKEQQ
jgi:hypothetical protein